MTSELESIAKNKLKNDVCSIKFNINNSKNNKIICKLLTIHDGKNSEYKDIYVFDNIILKSLSFLQLLRYSLLIASVLFYDEPKIHDQSSLGYENNEVNQKKIDSEILLENFNGKTTLLDHFKKIEYERYNSASKLMKTIENELKDKNKAVSNASESFKDGIDEWKQQKIYEAQTEMLAATFNVAVRIGMMVIRPDGIVGIIKPIEKTSTSVQDAEKVIEFAKNNKDISDQKIKQINENLKGNSDTANDLNNKIDPNFTII
ncbi:hypothetical protein F8M41_012000 [Gigaspora margarita]|uniref:Uncharacterized protein n=1 Tax=Gigaspora margarita TaxID=4874 RepID=A0A8H4ATE2_GIGMA|nr:hypothetical protein F8M41_012000 [Gigaspora margarita]